MSLIQHHRFHQNWLHQLGFMIIFPRCPVSGLFNIDKFCGLPRVTVSSSRFETWTIEIIFHSLVGNLPKFHLDLHSPRYSNSPQVSCLGMNPRRGWSPNLQGSYLKEYSESEAAFWIQCTSGFYLQPMQFLAPEPSPMSEYSESTKT